MDAAIEALAKRQSQSPIRLPGKGRRASSRGWGGVQGRSTQSSWIQTSRLTITRSLSRTEQAAMDAAIKALAKRQSQSQSQSPQGHTRLPRKGQGSGLSRIQGSNVHLFTSHRFLGISCRRALPEC